MMGHLFAVDLGSIGVGTLKCLADYWVELRRFLGTGFRNMLK
jgi:hypothetical protein